MTIQATIKTAAFTLISALALTGAAACDGEEFADESSDTQLRPGGVPWKLNTTDRNGQAMPGIDLTGEHFYDHTFLSASIVLNGDRVPVDGIEVVDGELLAHIGDDTYGGDQLDDAYIKLWGALEPELENDDQEFAAILKIVVSHELDDNGEHVYLLRYGDQNAPDTTLETVCAADSSPTAPVDANAQHHAYLMRDVDVSETGEFSVRPNTMYMACVSGAIGKLGQWGYYRHELSLSDMQALTRATRKDLCGDGVSYTTVGAEFNISDDLGVNPHPQKLGSRIEAYWGAHGATCQGASSREDQVPLPSCYTDLPQCNPLQPSGIVTIAPIGGTTKTPG